MMKSFECITKDLGYYFIGDGQFEEFLTPLDLEAIEIRPRPGQRSALSLPFNGLASPQVSRAELVTLWFMALC